MAHRWRRGEKRPLPPRRCTIHAPRHGPCLTCPLPACRRYRMRWHRFVLLKPFILLAVVPLERSLCRQACDTMPGAHVLTSRPSPGQRRVTLPPLCCRSCRCYRLCRLPLPLLPLLPPADVSMHSCRCRLPMCDCASHADPMLPAGWQHGSKLSPAWPCGWFHSLARRHGSSLCGSGGSGGLAAGALPPGAAAAGPHKPLHGRRVQCCVLAGCCLPFAACLLRRPSCSLRCMCALPAGLLSKFIWGSRCACSCVSLSMHVAVEHASMPPPCKAAAAQTAQAPAPACHPAPQAP